MSETKDGIPLTYGYDDNDKLTSVAGGGKTASFGYDGNGSMTSVSGDTFGSWTLVYDDANRPTSIAYPAGADMFVYNAFGQRTRANLSGAIFRYVYHGERVREQTDDSGNLLSRYATAGASYYGPLLEFELPDGSQRYPLYDMAGTARRLADASGTITDAYPLDAFGRRLGGWGSTENPYQYGAEWGYTTDPSGMQQLGARFYWPEIGRFVQQDPAGDGMNWHAYAGNCPGVYVDPGGLAYVDISGSAGIPGVGTIGGVQIGPDPCDPRPFWHWVHPYGGFGLMAGLPVGPTPLIWGGSIMAGSGNPSSGRFNALQIGGRPFRSIPWPVGISGGNAPGSPDDSQFIEGGYSTPDLFAGTYWVY